MIKKAKAVFIPCWGAREKGLLGISKLKQELQKIFDLCIPAIPGNGIAAPPEETWDTDDYAKYIIDEINKIGSKNLTLIGHSFGGGIALKIAELNPKLANKMILVEPVLGIIIVEVLLLTLFTIY